MLVNIIILKEMAKNRAKNRMAAETKVEGQLSHNK